MKCKDSHLVLVKSNLLEVHRFGILGIVFLLSACGGTNADTPISNGERPPVVQQPVPPAPIENSGPSAPIYRADTLVEVNPGPWVVLGSSTAAGLGVPSGKGWVSIVGSRLAVSGANFSNLAKPGTTTYHGLSATAMIPAGRPAYDPSVNIDLALNYRPRVVILAYPTNDTLLGYSEEETVKNLLDMRAAAHNRGAQVLVMSTQPRDLEVEKRKVLQRINVRLKAVVTKCFVDVYTPLADTEGRLKNVYESGDGTHPNSDGHLLIANLVEQFINGGECIRLKK